MKYFVLGCIVTTLFFMVLVTPHSRISEIQVELIPSGTQDGYDCQFDIWLTDSRTNTQKLYDTYDFCQAHPQVDTFEQEVKLPDLDSLLIQLGKGHEKFDFGNKPKTKRKEYSL